MNKDEWGRHAWAMMHAMAEAYPDDPTIGDRWAMCQFFESLVYTIPCIRCRAHYTENITQSPPDVSSRNGLMRWLFNLHNVVNRQLGKPEMSWDDYIAGYNTTSAGNNNHNNNQLAIILGVVVIIMLMGVVSIYYIRFTNAKAKAYGYVY